MRAKNRQRKTTGTGVFEDVKNEKVEALQTVFVELSPEEYRLLLKAVLITGCFLTFYSPYMGLVLVQIITNIPASKSIDQIVCLGIVLNAFINPILLYKLDNRVKQNVNSFLQVLVT